MKDRFRDRTSKALRSTAARRTDRSVSVTIRSALLLLLIAAPVVAGAQERRLPPVDTCASDRSFVAFRQVLSDAIARRDAAYILATATDDIASDADAETGRAGFIRYWGLFSSATSGLWRELAAALRLGCARDSSGMLRVPSMSLDEEAPDDATYGGYSVAMAGTRLRADPCDEARVVRTLHWDLFALRDDDDGRSEWIFIQLADGAEGFVRRDQIRRLADRTAYFQRQSGRWRLVGFFLGE